MCTLWSQEAVSEVAWCSCLKQKAVYYLYWCMVFFFSSRRRHTRCSRDWSSDVCSSDLEDPQRRGLLFAATEGAVWSSSDDGEHWESLQLNLPRSEERRVGKECRSRWSPYH